MKYTQEEIFYFRERIVLEVKKLVGVPFSHGGITCSGLDCKGLGWLAYYKAGIRHIPSSDGRYYNPDWYLFADKNRYLDGLLKYFNFTKNPQKADLAMFATTKEKDIANHAAILIGKRRFIHARNAYKVTPDSLDHPYWNKVFKFFLVLKEFDI